MRGDHQRAVRIRGEQLAHAAEQGLRPLRVLRGSGLVEQQRAIGIVPRASERKGQHQPLPLAAREAGDGREGIEEPPLHARIFEAAEQVGKRWTAGLREIVGGKRGGQRFVGILRRQCRAR